MVIAVASGKGGTGKTTIAVNLAYAIGNAQIIDCDVEEPNAHLFLFPEIHETEPVGIPVPVVDDSLCDGCGTCGEVCEFSAIVVINKRSLCFRSSAMDAERARTSVPGRRFAKSPGR